MLNIPIGFNQNATTYETIKSYLDTLMANIAEAKEEVEKAEKNGQELGQGTERISFLIPEDAPRYNLSLVIDLDN